MLPSPPRSYLSSSPPRIHWNRFSFERERKREMTNLGNGLHIHHPSHPHVLTFSDLSCSPVHAAAALHPPCWGCKRRASGYMYSCKPCSFALHAQCAHMQPLITHPGHENHPLELLTSPAYANGSFNCNGCRQRGSGFSYHCAECRFDLHIVCASKPLRIRHQSHHHELHLAFDLPYETRMFSCGVCRAIGGNHWLYRCSCCNFDVHLECDVVTRAGPVQVVPAPQQASYAAAAQPVYNSSGLNHQYQYQNPTALGPGNMQGVIHNPHNMHMGSSQHQVQPIMRPWATGLGAFSVVAAAEQGLVQGVAQQVGQNLAQNLMGGGDGGGSLDFSSFFNF